ncbi:MAG TPA: methyltransferase domain-containing protein [Candidatus Limnocylindrales bacterium]|nr:methyltransferase domain-containing protein [Candidatus Limnocylindrales bacterium]
MTFDSPTLRASMITSHVGFAAGERVLDVSLYGRLGHGQQPISIAIQRSCHGAVVTAVYENQRLRASAQRKLTAAGVDVALMDGRPEALPFQPMSFDTVVSSLLFHHLDDARKQRVLREMHRVLGPGGRIVVLDWTRPATAALRLAFWTVRATDGFLQTAAACRGELVRMMQQAGFADASEVSTHDAFPGTLGLFCGSKASAGLHTNGGLAR